MFKQTTSVLFAYQMLQCTIKRAPPEQRRSLADLFGGSDVGGGGVRPSSAPEQQRRSLASLFPTGAAAPADSNGTEMMLPPAGAAINAAGAQNPEDDGAAVVSPRQQVRQLADQIEARTEQTGIAAR